MIINSKSILKIIFVALFFGITLQAILFFDAKAGFFKDEGYAPASEGILVRQRAEALIRGKVSTLNHFMPSLIPIMQFLTGKRDKEDVSFQEYAGYYSRIIQFLPEDGYAYGMLGFCYYHLDRVNEAVEMYQIALEKAPHFFWFQYSLGLIYIEQGEYELAIESLRGALETEPRYAYEHVTRSKVLMSLAEQFRDPEVAILLRLREGFRKARLVVAEAVFYLYGSANAEAYLKDYVEGEITIDDIRQQHFKVQFL